MSDNVKDIISRVRMYREAKSMPSDILEGIENMLEATDNELSHYKRRAEKAERVLFEIRSSVGKWKDERF